MQKLKLCPFCNGNPRLVVFKDPYVTSYVNYNFCVSCDDCGGEGATSESVQNNDCRGAIDEAIVNWNARHAT